MKCFMGFNEKTEWYDNYVRYIKCAINSLVTNTSLDPHFMYSGSSCELTNWLLKKGVTVHFVKSRWYSRLTSQQNYNSSVACGAFLRVKVPEICMEYGDEYALYTDCDVMFLKDIILTEKPKYLSAVTEFSNDFNSGVMLMNIKNMHQDLPALERLFNCIDITTLVNYDQGLYNLFCQLPTGLACGLVKSQLGNCPVGRHSGD
jgi:lipopolysaccharide biosynthesis glycosyltransferase